MRLTKNGKIIFSPSDLIVFSMSPFASWMDHASKAGVISVVPEETRPDMEFLAKMGDEHEKKVLEGYRSLGPVCDLYSEDGFDARSDATKEALARREKVLYQAALRGGGFEGYSDFITLGPDNVYQIWDTKLARAPKPYFLIQLCAYTEMFAETTGESPAKKIGIILGPPENEGEESERVEFAFEDFRYYYENLKQRFFTLHNNFSGDIETRPEPEPRADHGKWQEYVEELLKERDHLCRVAGITRSQIDKLSDNGVSTLRALAEFKGSVPKMPPATVAKLTTQARLQRATEKLRETDKNAPPLFELIPKNADGPPQGLYSLPKPSPSDVFFDIEGFPFNGGLEYLLGNTIHKKGGGYDFVEFWAHDRASEKKAFEAFIDWVFKRWEEDDSLHIYHYANYEQAAVSNLMTRHDTRESEVDTLLRNNVFVDLYRIVKNGVYVGEESYSLKKVEHLYNVVRGENVASAVDSVLQYAAWIESGESGDWRESKILRDIREYNKVDCESTADLYAWLQKTAAENGIRYLPYQIGEEPKEKPEERDAFREREAVVSGLRKRRNKDEDAGTLSDLIGFHRREEKPTWWRFFNLAKKLPEELFDEPDCIAEIASVGEPGKVDKSLTQEYAFDRHQECKLSSAKPPTVVFQVDTRTDFTLFDLDHSSGKLVLKATQNKLNNSAFGGEFPTNGSLIAKDSFGSKQLADALTSIGRNYLDDKVPASLRAFLSRRSPTDAVQREGETTVEAAIRIADTMDGDCLVIQGPPGTGKTYTAARLILSLLDKGKRIGITSNSHKAILNLIKECCEAAEKQKQNLSVVKVGGDKADPVFEKHPELTFAPDSGKGFQAWLNAGKTPLIGGTAWLFARDSWVENDGENMLDFLFVDEAGQVCVANAVAVSRATKNLVLLGDQMQLEQPIQGMHPGDSGLSSLQYALKDLEESKDGVPVIHPVVPPGTGLFLGTSRRMHPDVCEFISESIYEDRLESYADCSRQRIAIANAPNSFIEKEHGIVFSPVEHDGDTQYSDEEVERVVAIFNELLGREYTDSSGKTRPLELKDFLFITPYNAQVVRLTSLLPEKARIGSVDRLQGQQAPVCILSLCSSVGEYGSRGLSFILDRNRINVAVSRAQCLAVVVADPRIADDAAGSIKEMKLLNLFCKLSKY